MASRHPRAAVDDPAARGLGARLAGSFGYGRAALALTIKAAPLGTAFLALFTLTVALLPPALAYVGKLIVDGVVHVRALAPGAMHDQALVAVERFVGWEVALVVIYGLLERALGLTRQLVGGRLGIAVNVMIVEKALTLELAQFEDAEFYDKLVRARREASWRPLSLVQENFQILRNAIALAGYAALIWVFRPWMIGALVVASIPAFLSETRFSVAAFRMTNWRSPLVRRMNYLEYALANDEHAKEVKLFGLGPVFLDRYRRIAEDIFAQDKNLAIRRTGWGYALSLLSTFAFYGCYVVIVLGTVGGKLSLGDMTLYLVAFRSGQQSLQAILASLSGLYEHNLYMSNLVDYLAMPPARAPRGDTSPRVADERGVRFDHVTFRYPGTPAAALDDIDVFLPPGASLALVGENGAGKTTFIKLLTRLYRPTSGRILLDGRDLEDWEEGELRRRIGVIFQDFNQYQLLVRENVGVGSVDAWQDSDRVARAVDRGGASEVVGALPQGLEAQLGRWFKEGVELSGGQWQKIALARAFMREEADILVLDEPTAALDAEAEHAVFRRFRELSQGRTTIVISHRFPTVRMADRILVLDKGRVIEEGTHADLLARRGRYAHLFNLQAEGYQ